VGSSLPRISTQTNGESADIVEAPEFGANDYASKPVDFAVALARMNAHVGHKRAIPGRFRHRTLRA
jgi:DNA-binding response OmpR family regulator